MTHRQLLGQVGSFVIRQIYQDRSLILGAVRAPSLEARSMGKTNDARIRQTIRTIPAQKEVL